MLSHLMDILALIVWIGAVLFWLSRVKTDSSRIRDNLHKVINQDVSSNRNNQEQEQAPLRAFLIKIGNNISVFNAQQRNELGSMLVHAGWRSPTSVSVLIACKVLCGLGMALTSLLFSLPEAYNTLSLRSLLFLGLLVVGAIIPEYLLKNRVNRRQHQIEQSLPDTLDLLVICTNAGYSLGASLNRTAEELLHICPPLADEIEVTTNELKLSGDSGKALRNLASRIGTPSIRSLVVTLLQSQQYGTPITQALRQLARSERTARMLRLEEAASKLSTKITIPMMFFILPAVILISAGPAIINLMSMVKGH